MDEAISSDSRKQQLDELAKALLNATTYHEIQLISQKLDVLTSIPPKDKSE